MKIAPFCSQADILLLFLTPGHIISIELCTKSCMIGKNITAVFHAEMHSDSNIDILLQLVRTHRPVFASTGDMDTFDEWLFVTVMQLCPFVRFFTKSLQRLSNGWKLPDENQKVTVRTQRKAVCRKVWRSLHERFTKAKWRKRGCRENPNDGVETYTGQDRWPAACMKYVCTRKHPVATWLCVNSSDEVWERCWIIIIIMRNFLVFSLLDWL